MSQRHTFGFWTLVCLVIANMIGAGVYTTSGFTLADLHTPGRVMLAWFLAGLIALAGAASYGKLVEAMPESGGEYLFLSRALHPMLGFVAGWVSLIAGFTGAIAFAATVLETYLQPASLGLPANSIAIAAILLAGLAHGLKPKHGATAQNGFVVLKLCLLLGFICFALTRITPHEIPAPVAVAPGPADGDSIAAFAVALVWISLSYAGFNAAVYLAEETGQPRKRVAPALLVGTLITTVLYLALNAIFVYLPDPADIAGKPDVAARAAEAIGGAKLAAFVRGVIALSLFTSVTSMIHAAPRVYAKMADDGLFPAFLKRGEGHPRTAILAQCILAILFVLPTSLESLAQYLGLTLSVCSALSVACLFLPRVREQVPLGWFHLVPAAYITATLVTAGLMTTVRTHQLWAMTITFAVGAGMYVIVRWSAKPRP